MDETNKDKLLLLKLSQNTREKKKQNQQYMTNFYYIAVLFRYLHFLHIPQK